MRNIPVEVCISILSDDRYNRIKKREESWVEETELYTIDEDPVIDELADIILEKIKSYRKELSFEFIMTNLTKLGYALNIIYDDNGNFAVSSDGWGPVFLEPEDVVDSVFQTIVEKDMWKSDIREALNYFLDNC